MLALADLAKTTLLKWVSFDLTYLKIASNEVLVSFILAFCFEVLIFVWSSHCYTHIFRHSVLKIGRMPDNVSVFFYG